MRIGWVGKVILSAAGPLLIGSGVFGWIMLGSVRDLERGRIEDALRSEAKVLGASLQGRELDPATLEPRIQRVADEVGNRITVVAADGRVLADSTQADVSAMENHGARPEIREARMSGKVTVWARFSDTIDRELLYAAARIGDSDAVVRVARDYSGVQEELARAGRAFWFLLGGLVVFCLLAAVIFARRVARPVAELTAAAQAVEHGDLTARVLPTGKDEVSALGHSFNRMTEQLTHSLEAARSEAARITTLLDGMSEGVLAIDADERISFLNGKARSLLGLTDTIDVEKKHLFELVRDPRILTIAQRAAEDGGPTEAEIVQEGPPRRILLAHAHPVGGESSDTILVISDRSRMRRLERMRSDFVSNVSHELRTPLASISAAVETLEDDEAREDPETGVRFVSMIKRNVQRLEALLNDILALSRLESRPETLRRVPIDFSALVRMSGEELRDRAHAAGLKLDVRAERRVGVLGDAQLLRRITDNLLVNAISYTPDGGRIDVRVAADGDDATLTVKDSGIGIPASDLDRIFERFYRVDKARSRSAGGTGLGLAIVKHAVGLHQGSVVVESEAGQGTTFTVRIPLTGPDATPEETELT